eukprot:TRINITY_DN10830_c0_g1_i2.p1 TRINITY_DN10830_c0_g1~~TRINITY_DN10830_c0_g1_i2.p1  ORF type:complete len:1713 (+),score=420.77 TRINITY_DN10830_c0_g1_i2:133-5271(+)
MEELCAADWEQRARHIAGGQPGVVAAFTGLLPALTAACPAAALPRGAEGGWAAGQISSGAIAGRGSPFAGVANVLQCGMGAARCSPAEVAAALAEVCCRALVPAVPQAPAAGEQPRCLEQQPDNAECAAALVALHGVLTTAAAVDCAQTLRDHLLLPALLAQPCRAFPLLLDGRARSAALSLAAELCAAAEQPPSPPAAAAAAEWMLEAAEAAVGGTSGRRGGSRLSALHCVELFGVLLLRLPPWSANAERAFQGATAVAASSAAPAAVRAAAVREAVLPALSDPRLPPALRGQRKRTAWEAAATGSLAADNPSAACDLICVLHPAAHPECDLRQDPRVLRIAAGALAGGGDAARRACHLLRRVVAACARSPPPQPQVPEMEWHESDAAARGEAWAAFFRAWEALDDHALHLVRPVWQASAPLLLPGPRGAPLVPFVPWGATLSEKALRHGNSGVRKLAAAALLELGAAAAAPLSCIGEPFACGPLLRACSDPALYSRGDQTPPRHAGGAESAHPCVPASAEELLPQRVQSFYAACLGGCGDPEARRRFCAALLRGLRGPAGTSVTGLAMFLRVLSAVPCAAGADLLSEESAELFADLISTRIFGAHPPWIEARLTAAAVAALFNLSRGCAARDSDAEGGLPLGAAMRLLALAGRAGSTGGPVGGLLDRGGLAGARGSALSGLCPAELSAGAAAHFAGGGVRRWAAASVEEALRAGGDVPTHGAAQVAAAELAAAAMCLPGEVRGGVLQPVADWLRRVDLRPHAPAEVLRRVLYVVQELLAAAVAARGDCAALGVLAPVLPSVVTLAERSLSPPAAPAGGDAFSDCNLHCGVLYAVAVAAPETDGLGDALLRLRDAAAAAVGQYAAGAADAQRAYHDAARLRDQLCVLRTLALLDTALELGALRGGTADTARRGGHFANWQGARELAGHLAAVNVPQLPAAGCPAPLADVAWPQRLMQLQRYRWEVARAVAAALPPESAAERVQLAAAAHRSIATAAPGNLAAMCDVAGAALRSTAPAASAAVAEDAVPCLQKAFRGAVRREQLRCNCAAAAALLHVPTVLRGTLREHAVDLAASVCAAADARACTALPASAAALCSAMTALLSSPDGWVDGAEVRDALAASLWRLALDVAPAEDADGLSLTAALLEPAPGSCAALLPVHAALAVRLPPSDRPDLVWRAAALAVVRGAARGHLASRGTPHPALPGWFEMLFAAASACGPEDRVMPNTPKQRRTARAWQAIGLLLEGLDHTLAAAVVGPMIRCLAAQAMQSTRRLAEVVCAAAAVRFPAPAREALRVLLSDPEAKPQVHSSAVVVAWHAMLHGADAGAEVAAYLPAVVPQLTSNHFVLRLVAQLAVHAVLSEPRCRPHAVRLLGAAVADSLAAFLGQHPDCVKWQERYAAGLQFEPLRATAPRALLCALRREGDAWLDDSLPAAVAHRASRGLVPDLGAATSALTLPDQLRVELCCAAMRQPAADLPGALDDGCSTDFPAPAGQAPGAGGEPRQGDGERAAPAPLQQAKITPWKEALFADDAATVREAAADREKQPIVLVASLVSNPVNVAALARAAEVFGAEEMPIANRKRVFGDRKHLPIAMSAEQWLAMPEVPEGAELAQYLAARRCAGYRIVGVEQTTGSQRLDSYAFPVRCVVVLGRERTGIPPEVIAELDDCVEIAQLGLVRSLNVHVCGALVLHEYTRQRIARGELRPAQASAGAG